MARVSGLPGAGGLGERRCGLLLDLLMLSPSPPAALQVQRRPVPSTSPVSRHSSSRTGVCRAQRCTPRPRSSHQTRAQVLQSSGSLRCPTELRVPPTSLPRCPSGSEHPSQVQGAHLRALWGSGSLRRLFLSHLRGLSTHQGRSHSPADPGHRRRLHAAFANCRHTPRRPPPAGKNARLLPHDASPYPGPPGSGHIKVLPSQTRRRLLCFTPTISPIFPQGTCSDPGLRGEQT